MEIEKPKRIFEIDAHFYHHATVLVAEAGRVHGGIDDVRKRDEPTGRTLAALLYGAVGATFAFIEAYLNGLAYVCFHRNHDALPIEVHDELGEWDSRTKKTKFVAFDRKVFRYPHLVAKTDGRHVDLSGCKSCAFNRERRQAASGCANSPIAIQGPEKRHASKASTVFRAQDASGQTTPQCGEGVRYNCRSPARA
jgi:hypothetical protein